MARKEYSDYRGDVTYEVWRSGYSPDDVSDDRISNGYYGGQSTSEVASGHIRAIEERRERARQDEYDEQEAYALAEQEAEYYRCMEAEYNRQCERDHHAMILNEMHGEMLAVVNWSQIFARRGLT